MDPVIAYMDAYEAACRVFNQKSTSDLEKPDPAAFEKLENELMATRHEALRTVPTSLEGLMRQARYHRELNMSPNERTHDKDVDHFLRQMPGVLDALFNGPKNDRLLELIEERRAIVAKILAHSEIGDRIYGTAKRRFPSYLKSRDRAHHPDRAAYEALLEDLGEPEWDRKAEELLAAKVRNEKQIARCKVRSIRALMELMKIVALGVNTNDDMSIAGEETRDKILRNIAAFGAASPTIAEEPHPIKAAA